ncbi:MAG: hypothetical protein ABSB19_06445 [Methylomonas sp.]|jgi:hypothetical protein
MPFLALSIESRAESEKFFAWRHCSRFQDIDCQLLTVLLHYGSIRIDQARLTYPGDILHEAGHLAVIPPECRRLHYIKTGKIQAEEMAAIAWSYAAAVHLDIDLAVLFHSGYKGGGQYLIDNFSAGRYIGLPVLQWLNMAHDARQAAGTGLQPYPAMQKWLLDAEIPE